MLPFDDAYDAWHERANDKRNLIPLPHRENEPQRRIVEENVPEQEADEVYIRLYPHLEEINEPPIYYFAKIQNVCSKLPRTRFRQDGFILYIDVTVPDDNDQDVLDFKTTVSQLVSFCYSYTHLSIYIKFTLNKRTE